MLGSSVLDIAIGLVFVYLLLSLVVTAASELIAAWFKRRHDNLWRGITNLLGEACAEKLYAHPLIDGLSPPPSLKWADVHGLRQGFQWLLTVANVDARGPSYIPSRTFVVSLLDTVGFKPGTGLANDLRRALEGVPDALVDARTVKGVLLQVLGSPPVGSELGTLLDHIPDTTSAAVVKQEVLRFLDRVPLEDPWSGLPPELQGTDLAKSLRLLWDEAGHDLDKFKEDLEDWFNNAMDRVSGWYKRETQLVNLTLAVVFTLALNVDTILLVNTLNQNSALRDSLVAQATKFAEQPLVQLRLAQAGIPEVATTRADAGLSATNEPFSLTLDPKTVAGGEDLKGILTLRETNAAGLTFKLSSSATNLVSVPAAVTIPAGQKSAEFAIKTRSLADSARVDVGASNRMAVLQLSPSPREQFRAARAELDNLNLPIGWLLETTKPRPPAADDRNHQLFRLLAWPTQGLFWSTVAFHWLGWVLTAIAVSLGAPFWFDLLNTFMTIRSSGAAPKDKPNPPTGSPQLPATTR
jgi:hypothetical protein